MMQFCAYKGSRVQGCKKYENNNELNPISVLPGTSEICLEIMYFSILNTKYVVSPSPVVNATRIVDFVTPKIPMRKK